MRECLFKSGNLTNLTSTITKCQMLVWPELIFSDPPVSHLGDVFFATFSPSKNPPHLTSGRLFLQLFCSLESAHLTSVWLRLRLLVYLLQQVADVCNELKGCEQREWRWSEPFLSFGKIAIFSKRPRPATLVLEFLNSLNFCLSLLFSVAAANQYCSFFLEFLTRCVS